MQQSKPKFLELCFVLMPFGERKDASGRLVQFNTIYEKLIRPAIEEAELEAVRGDEELLGGMIHKQIFERLMLCPFAVADLSTANANVFYEVGVRHAARPHTTLLIHSSESDLKFDVHHLRSMPYSLDGQGGLADAEGDRRKLVRMLLAARQPVFDSPLFELFPNTYQPPTLPHEIADTFLERVRYSEDTKRALDSLRLRYSQAGKAKDTATQDAIRTELREFDGQITRDKVLDAGAWTALLLTYRACDGLQEMVDLVERMPAHVVATKVVQEQKGFALNRLGRRDEARHVLGQVIERFGDNPETNGLLGRVYKDLADAGEQAGDQIGVRTNLRRAIDTYLRGFEADWRDFYPGVNAVSLMDIIDDPRRFDLLPVVRYATARRIAALPEERQEYWELATMLELEALADRPEEASKWRVLAKEMAKEPWYLETTAKNLQRIAKRRRESGQAAAAEWIEREVHLLLGK